MTPERAVALVRRALGRRVAGYCYVASEAVYHLAGGKRDSGLVPMVLILGPEKGRNAKYDTHWFLRYGKATAGSYEYLDVTAGQFRPRLTRAEYARGRGCGFLTAQPSIGARTIIAAVRASDRSERKNGLGE